MPKKDESVPDRPKHAKNAFRLSSSVAAERHQSALNVWVNFVFLVHKLRRKFTNFELPTLSSIKVWEKSLFQTARAKFNLV